jgi:hypothetical protein
MKQIDSLATLINTLEVSMGTSNSAAHQFTDGGHPSPGQVADDCAAYGTFVNFTSLTDLLCLFMTRPDLVTR